MAFRLNIKNFSLIEGDGHGDIQYYVISMNLTPFLFGYATMVN